MIRTIMRSVVGVLGIVVCSSLLTTLAPAAHAQTTVNYRNMGTFTTNSLNSGGVTVTGTNAINVLDLNGFGIVGGQSNTTIDGDGSESILFTFNNGPGENVIVGASLFGVNNNASVANALEAFGVGGSSLGVFNFIGSPYDLSSRVNNAQITSFRITAGTNNYFRMGSLTYTPAVVAAVPEPSEWATMGIAASGLCGLMVRARRKNRKSRAGASVAA